MKRRRKGIGDTKGPREPIKQNDFRWFERENEKESEMSKWEEQMQKAVRCMHVCKSTCQSAG